MIQARKMDNDLRELHRKQKEEREALKIKQYEEFTNALEQQEIQKKQLLLKLQKYIEKSKNALIFDYSLQEPKHKRKCHENPKLNSDETIVSEPCGNGSLKHSKSNKSLKK